MIPVVEQVIESYERRYGTEMKNIMGDNWKDKFRAALTVVWENGCTQGMEKMYKGIYK